MFIVLLVISTLWIRKLRYWLEYNHENGNQCSYFEHNVI